MVEREVKVRNYPGIHAHPAGVLVKHTAGFQSEIFIQKGEVSVNGKSIMGVLMLAAEIGSVLTIRADGPDEEDAVTSIVALIENRFGEADA